MKKELKIKDVMIGDWVDVRNDAEPNTPHLERITPSHFLRDEHWYGVELVPEILEKNGFKYKEGEVGMYGVTTVPHYLCKGVPFEVFCDGDPLSSIDPFGTMPFSEAMDIAGAAVEDVALHGG